MNALLVTIGAGVGAPLRYLIDQYIKNRWQGKLPLGTLVINILGSFALGTVAAHNNNLLAIVGIGFAGAFTTWSTFILESFTLYTSRSAKTAIGYLLLTITACLTATTLGVVLS